MSQDGHDNQRHGEALAAQQVFGPQAAVYATSKVHIRDDSLESVERMVDAANGANRYGWTLDLGTGAGFTAFAVAGVSGRVIASDVTGPMLRQVPRFIGETLDLGRSPTPGTGAKDHQPGSESERRRGAALRRRVHRPGHLPGLGPPLPRLRKGPGRSPACSQERRVAAHGR